MAEVESDGMVVHEMPDLFAGLKSDVFYEITFKDNEVLRGMLFFDMEPEVWTATICSAKGKRRTFQDDEVLSVVEV